jgi:hypothetical protein
MFDGKLVHETIRQKANAGAIGRCMAGHVGAVSAPAQ